MINTRNTDRRDPGPQRHSRRLALTLGMLGLLAGACLCTSIPLPVDIPSLIDSGDAAPTVPAEPPTPTPVADAELLVLDDLAAANPAPRDRYDLAVRFLGVTEIPVVTPTAPQVGDIEEFWVSNDDTQGVVRIGARLVYANDVVAMWVEVGQDFDQRAVEAAADRFAEHIYPTTRAAFGSEPNPGIDGDARLHILHSIEMGSGVAGYFYSPNQYPESIVQYSNEREMFFVSLYTIGQNEAYYDSVLAHEFQHMIMWGVDRNEESWISEGLSEVASFINGYGTSEFAADYLDNTDVQLTSWPEDDTFPHYGAGFLFGSYFLDRFGMEGLQRLVAHPENGIAGVDAALDEMGAGIGADEVFADWAIATLLNDPAVPPGIYAYASQPNLPPPDVAALYDSFPVEDAQHTVHQYGVDTIQIEGRGEVTIRFEGTTKVRILPTSTAETDEDPASDDQFVWWSNRGDESDMTLTRTVDLRGVTQATLTFDVWYSIEDGWDYGYVEASTDGGQTWTILRGTSSTDANPQGNSYGLAYTGESAAQAGADHNGWLTESIDLSAYAGQEILLRFEMITDLALNFPGMAVDNICISEIGWCDSAETVDAGWTAAGWVRHNNILPQRFVVQIVLPSDDGSVQVLSFPLDESNRGEMTITLGERPAFVVVSGLTRFTTEIAGYSLSIVAAD